LQAAGLSTASLPAHPRILLIAPHNSYRIVPYVEAARKLGTEALIVSEGRYSLVSTASEGLHVELDNPSTALTEILKDPRVDGVVGVVGTDDATVELACLVAQALGLPHNAPEAALIARRKDLARARLLRAGLPVPAHRRIDLKQALEGQLSDTQFPCVVKPLSLSGSRGVIRADNPQQLVSACERVRAILSGIKEDEIRNHVLVEAYLPGLEVALEGMLARGELVVLALFDKPDSLEGPYFEETYYITPSRLDAALQDRIRRRVAEACAAYGLTEGPVHAELRVHDREAWILEIAARTIGGNCARLLHFGTRHSLEELVLAQAMGQPLPIQTKVEPAGVLMIPIPRAGVLRRIEGVLAAQRVPYVEDVELHIREGYELVPLPEGSSYLGFIFARAPTPQDVEAALRTAHRCLNIVTAPVWKLWASQPLAARALHPS
jgi:Biotin carboxylase